MLSVSERLGAGLDLTQRVESSSFSKIGRCLLWFLASGVFPLSHLFLEIVSEMLISLVVLCLLILLWEAVC